MHTSMHKNISDTQSLTCPNVGFDITYTRTTFRREYTVHMTKMQARLLRAVWLYVRKVNMTRSTHMALLIEVDNSPKPSV